MVMFRTGYVLLTLLNGTLDYFQRGEGCSIQTSYILT